MSSSKSLLTDLNAHSELPANDIAQEEARTIHTAQDEKWGTVFTQGREHALGGIEQTRSTYWTEADETAYLNRVQQKAKAMAAEMLEQAQAEVVAIQEAAHQEGYNKGLADAEEELNQFRGSMAESVSGVLAAIEAQCHTIFQQWRGDIVAVARKAVEKVACQQLAEDRATALANIITEAITMIEQERLLTITVNPEDQPVIQDIITVTKERYPEISTWQVTANPNLQPGSLVLENQYSMAQSKTEDRMALIDSILASMSLPDVP